MKLQIHSIHFDADNSLLEFIQKKLDKLETFYYRIIDGEVFLRIEKEESKNNKVIEIKLNSPKHQFFSKERADSFEVGIDAVVEALRRQIKKHKEKEMNH